jgi:uncharacterized membrane protein
MSPSDPRPWIDRLVSVCLSVLVGAVAIYVAVRLVEAVWAVLLVIVGASAMIAASASLLRRRNRDW